MMAILEKEVWVGLGTNIRYLEELGYKIPRRKDINGILSTPKGTEILVKIEHMPLHSSVKVTKICDIPNCGKHVTNQQYANIIKSRNSGDGKDRCPECLRKKASETRRNNVKYEKSLEFFAKENNREYLLNEFSGKNDKLTSEISFGSQDEHWWNCPKCTSEYEMSVQIRTKKGCGCPYCSGKKVNNTNCLSILYPELAKEWHPIKNGNLTPDQVTKGKKGKLWWLCPECDISYSATTNDRRDGCACPSCSESKGEKKIRKWLDENEFTYESQKEYVGLLGTGGGLLSYDFYLLKQNILIEYQGEFHDGTPKHQTKKQLKKQQEHDRRKKVYAELHNIDLLEIWYWDFDNVEEILNNRLRGI